MCASVVVGCDASPVLEFGEQVLDLVALTIEHLVIVVRHTTGENPVYPRADEACYVIGGTHGSLAIPSLEIWRNPGARSWWEPFENERVEVENQDPLVLQIRQFCKVIRGEEQPLVSGSDRIKTLKVIDAVKRSAASGKRIVLT